MPQQCNVFQIPVLLTGQKQEASAIVMKGSFLLTTTRALSTLVLLTATFLKAPVNVKKGTWRSWINVSLENGHASIHVKGIYPVAIEENVLQMAKRCGVPIASFLTINQTTTYVKEHPKEILSHVLNMMNA